MLKLNTCALLLAAALSSAAGAQNPVTTPALAIAPSGVPGMTDAMQSPDYWIARAADANTPLRTPDQLARLRASMYAAGGGFVDLQAIPPRITRAQVQQWLAAARQTPVPATYDLQGRKLASTALRPYETNRAANAIPATSTARYGLSVRRAALRALPTEAKFYASQDDHDFESLVAGVLFPGEPVMVVHTSQDKQWYLAVTTQGPAWVRSDAIAIGPREDVFAYAAMPPGRVVTASQVTTVYTPENPGLSEVALDMGAALPAASVPPDAPVNGASPTAAWPVLLPARAADGSLRLSPALIQRSRETSDGYLPLTRANIIRQSFKFLGERYGWGHTFNARDCSGLTGDTYRSMGVLLPPSSSLQGSSSALAHRTFTSKDSHEDRLRALAEAQVGDLVVVPGHVLMIVGHVDGQPYVIQDVPYAVFKDPATGVLRKTKLNQVSVTPLLPLYADDKLTYVDAMTSLVHVTGS